MAVDTIRLERRRSTSRYFRALTQMRQYKAALEAFRAVRNPVSFLWRYATGQGHYPTTIELRTPIGIVQAKLFSWHDSRTIHEIFLAKDYAASSTKIFVDFGSNIGISALYFASRDAKSVGYLYEPVPANIERLRQNTRAVADRVQIHPVAVGVTSGKVRFGVEPSGRYGGIGLDTGDDIEVDCLDTNGILTDIIAKHGEIDVLKIDVETMEAAIVEHLNPQIAARIALLIVEYRFSTNPLAATHSMTQEGTISRFERRRVTPAKIAA